jgi:hypothetical protein
VFDECGEPAWVSGPHLVKDGHHPGNIGLLRPELKKTGRSKCRYRAGFWVPQNTGWVGYSRSGGEDFDGVIVHTSTERFHSIGIPSKLVGKSSRCPGMARLIRSWIGHITPGSATGGGPCLAAVPKHRKPEA